MSELQGGKFLHGFASGAISSAVSSGASALRMGPELMIMSGGLGGGLGSWVTGGSFIDGVRQGIISSGLNHAMHESLSNNSTFAFLLEGECPTCPQNAKKGQWHRESFFASETYIYNGENWDLLVTGTAPTFGLAKGVGSFLGSVNWLKGGKTFRQYKAGRGGTKTLDWIDTASGSQRISTEFAHVFITQRTHRLYNLPNWMVNNRLNVWKLNTVQHSLIDTYRFKFLRAAMKNDVGWFGKYNWLTKF